MSEESPELEQKKDEGQVISIAEMVGKPRPKVPKAAPPEQKLVLDQDMQSRVVDRWNQSVEKNEEPPSMEELIEVAWCKKFDPRTPEGLAVRNFVSDKKLFKNERPATEKYVLTEEQKKYIDNNAFTMRASEITKILFRDEKISHLSLEGRAVSAYYDEVNQSKTTYEKGGDDVTDEGYYPPTSMPQVIGRTKKYVPMSQLDYKNLNQKQKKCAEALMAYLHTLRFESQITSFTSKKDRELFESEFIRCCYDKADLTEEEVDQYIVYSNEVVISRNILKSINFFQAKLEDDASEEGKKMSLTLVEAIGKMRDEYNSSIKRQQELLKDLKGKRSDRMKEKMSENASIVNLVQAWKEKDFRDKTIHLAIKRQEAIKETIKELTDMDEVKARIFGLSEDEVLHG